jgi:hypothetical protein
MAYASFEKISNLTPDFQDYMTRMNSLTVPMLRMWERVLKDPTDKTSYILTDEEVLLIKHTAEAFLAGDKSGK